MFKSLVLNLGVLFFSLCLCGTFFFPLVGCLLHYFTWLIPSFFFAVGWSVGRSVGSLGLGGLAGRKKGIGRGCGF